MLNWCLIYCGFDCGFLLLSLLLLLGCLFRLLGGLWVLVVGLCKCCVVYLWFVIPDCVALFVGVFGFAGLIWYLV